MKIKNILKLFAVSLLIVSCEYEEDLFQLTNDNPNVMFVYKGVNTEQINDSLKIPLTDLGTAQIPFEMVINDKSQNLNLLVNNFIQGDLSINGSAYDGTGHTIKNGKHEFDFVPTSTGHHNIELEIKDSYGQSHTSNLKFYVFDNLTPVAVCKVNTIGQNSQYEIEILAGDSYDQDAKWGGRVQSYIYKIGSYYTLETERFSSIKHILPGPGKYVISVQVKDNDGGLSAPTYTEIEF